MAGKRFKLDEARAALLEAGLQLMVDHGPAPGLQRISFADAIELSGVPRPSAYRAFADSTADPQDFFRDQLAVEVIENCAFKVLQPTVDSVQHLMDAAAEETVTSTELDWLMRETIRIGIASYQEHLANDPLFDSFISLIASRQRGSQLSDVIYQAEVDAQKQYIAFYRVLFETFGLRLRKTWNWEAIATAMTAIQTGDHLISGLAIQGSPIDRPTGPNGDVVPWTLYACMIEALIAAATEPDPRMVVSAQPDRWLQSG